MTVRPKVVDVDTGEEISGEEQYFELLLNNIVIRPGERLSLPHKDLQTGEEKGKISLPATWD